VVTAGASLDASAKIEPPAFCCSTTCSVGAASVANPKSARAAPASAPLTSVAAAASVAAAVLVDSKACVAHERPSKRHSSVSHRAFFHASIPRSRYPSIPRARRDPSRRRSRRPTARRPRRRHPSIHSSTGIHAHATSPTPPAHEFHAHEFHAHPTHPSRVFPSLPRARLASRPIGTLVTHGARPPSRTSSPSRTARVVVVTALATRRVASVRFFVVALVVARGGVTARARIVVGIVRACAARRDVARDVDVGARVLCLFPTRSIDPIPLAPSRIRARVTSTSGRAFYAPRDRSIRYRSHRLEYARA